jgi:hypothetical protein
VARQTGLRKSSEKRGSRQSAKSSSFVLILIGLFKLFKALLLIAVGIGAIKLLHKEVVSTLVHWTQLLGVDSDNRFVHGMLVKVFRVTPKQLKELSVATFLYAGYSQLKVLDYCYANVGRNTSPSLQPAGSSRSKSSNWLGISR